MKEIANIHISYKILAAHFNKGDEAMRINYKKYKEDKGGFWLIYVKAYNFDKGIMK
jgi:hypothetical protein